jgi:hypothetical protein
MGNRRTSSTRHDQTPLFAMTLVLGPSKYALVSPSLLTSVHLGLEHADPRDERLRTQVLTRRAVGTRLAVTIRTGLGNFALRVIGMQVLLGPGRSQHGKGDPGEVEELEDPLNPASSARGAAKEPRLAGSSRAGVLRLWRIGTFLLAETRVASQSLTGVRWFARSRCGTSFLD